MNAGLANTSKPPRRTQSQRRAEADAKMLEAAVEIIAEKGVAGLALAEVASRAGYSATLPLHYYKTRETLILRTAELILGEYNAIMMEKLEGVAGLDAITTFIRAYLRYTTENATRRRAFFMITSEAAVNASLQEGVAALTRSGASALAGLIRDGQRFSEIEPIVDPDVFGSLILASVRGVISLWAVDPSIDLDRMETALVGSVVRVLRDREAPSAESRPQ